LVISFDKKISKLNEDMDISKAKEIARIAFRNIVNANKKYGFDEKFLNYDAVLHKNTGKYHIHMRMYQPKYTPDTKMVNRMKLVNRGFSEAKFNIANIIKGLEENKEIYVKKSNLENDIKDINRSFLKSLDEKQIRSHATEELSKLFNGLKKQQAAVFKLFKAQPVEYSYFDNNKHTNAKQKGLALFYDNLSVPCYSLKDLKENNIDESNKKLQPEQITYKTMLDNYAKAIVEYDQALNKQSREFNKFCEEYKKDRIDKLAGNEKTVEGGMKELIDKKVETKIFNDLNKNVGNEVIRCVAACNVANKGKNKASPTKTKLSRCACNGNIQKQIHESFQKYNHDVKNNTVDINVLKPLDEKYLDKQIRDEKNKEKLEQIANDLGISVAEVRQKLKNKNL
jgi:hypothetical protein